MTRFLLFLFVWLFAFDCWAQKPTIRHTFNAITQTYTFRLDNEPTLDAIKGESESPSWGYYWEFGDGHYATGKNPQHQFESGKEGGVLNYRIDLYLTPQYAYKAPRGVSYTLYNPVQAFSFQPPDYGSVLNKKNVNAGANHDEIVPGQEMQVILSYKVPEIYKGATLLFLFNQTEYFDRTFDFDYKTFRTPNGERLIKTSIGKLTQTITTSNSCKSRYLDQVVRKYRDVLAFNLNEVPKGKDLRMFMSLLPNATLSSGKISFQTLLVPESRECDDKSIFEYTVEILPSHDPNQIYVSNTRLEYLPNQMDTLTYEVRFENKGKGDERNVRIAVAIDEGLVAKTVEVGERVPDCEYCPPDIATRVGFTQSCLEKQVKLKGENPHISDSLIFTFHNILLAGTARRGSDAKRHGKISYKLLTSGKEVNEIASTAAIYFSRAESKEPVMTRTIKTQPLWKKAGLRVGVTPIWGGRSMRLGEGEAMPWNLALVYGNSRMEKGWANEVELAWSNFQFSRTQNSPIILPDPALQNAVIDFTSNVNTSFLDVLIQQRYHFNKYFGKGIGVGPSLLFNGKSQVNAEIKLENVIIDEVDKELGFGLFNLLSPVDALLAFPVADTTFDLGLTQSLEAYLGGVAFVDIGGGLVNKGIYGGIRYSFRWQNRIYNEPRVRLTYPMVYFQWKFLQGSKN